jgi:hypothetical protein
VTGRHLLTRGATRRWLALAALTLLVATALAACSPSSAKAIVLPTATTSSIQVAVDRTTYTVSQAIGVTVSNSASKTDYYAKTGKSVCTYLQLQEYNASKNVWVPVDACQTGDQPHALTIQHASSLPYTLAPESPANQNQWDPGTYRIELDYTPDATVASGIVTAYSAAFTITAAG